ncbi:MAG: pyridoxamine 5'-phosphate oxidase family protein [Flavobacteriales bacterium]|nr:pyridoxamine 5'-phosphate oxidase family protein [Flavobacteriales bacterium]
MARILPTLTETLIEFIRSQHLFFTATAAGSGRVNVSPKGMDTFRVLDAKQVGYLDLTGSGNETAAHLLHNGRITFLFCAFMGSPLILRLYGHGRVVRPGDPDWSELRPSFGPELPGERQLIVAQLDSVQTSCGFGIPLYTYEADRTQLLDWAVKKGEDGLNSYRSEKNARSIDGFPTGQS